jgi:starvation-inducible DNA-binding protein
MITEKTIDTANAAVVDGLKTLLADSYALMAQTHVAHWNVEGPSFFELHEAFQRQYEELFTAIDEIAERIRALEAYSLGGLATLAKASQVAELAIGALPAKDYVAHLVEAHELVCASARTLREHAGESGDLETQDLAIGRIRVHEKTLWMLKSFLKNL